MLRAAIGCSALLTIFACEQGALRSPIVDLRSRTLDNRSAYIPPQCYTLVAATAREPAQNPCYVCHADAPAPNELSQPELQLSYAFPQLRAGAKTIKNPWSNLFRERESEIAKISDATVKRYVSEDNYAGNLLADRLAKLPSEWDANGNGRWDGYVPDAHYHFDARGFDRDEHGAPTGYRVFAYYPLPGGFTPANGSFDDVLIRLPASFRTDRAGNADFAVYEVNLAIVEALIRRQDVAIDATDENRFGVDLDGDGQLAEANVVRYRFDPRAPERSLRYVGQAGLLLSAAKVHLAPGLFPEGTEFLHSVRYLAVGADGQVHSAPRMKELRYARKQNWQSYAQLRDGAQREAKEAALNPDRPELFAGDAERGLHNVSGWVLQGFIEDATGQLRPQSYEETVFCMGCHGGLSATEDSMFAFARKLSTGPAHGYYALRWGKGAPLPDPLRVDGLPEYATYLRQNRSGDAYRSQSEAREHFYAADGQARDDAFQALARDASTLLLPTAARALALDKAYWLIVREQSFKLGRDAVSAPAERVLRDVAPDQATGIHEVAAAPRLAITTTRPPLEATVQPQTTSR